MLGVGGALALLTSPALTRPSKPPGCRSRTKSKAAASAEKRKQQAKTAAAKDQQKAKEREQRARLKQLDTKSVSLAQKELALTAADEARRLRGEASKAKSSRKNGS